MKLGAAAAALLLFIAGGLSLDSRGGSDSPGGRSSPSAKAASTEKFDVDPCQYLTSADIQAATGLENMKGRDKGRSSGTGARVCNYDQGTGQLPTVTVFARPNATTMPDGSAGDDTLVDFARRSYQGADVPGVGDAAFATTRSIYVQRGDVTIEISALVMQGYLPAKLSGEPLLALGKLAAEKMRQS